VTLVDKGPYQRRSDAFHSRSQVQPDHPISPAEFLPLSSLLNIIHDLIAFRL
jgi:hypothetical protein